MFGQHHRGGLNFCRIIFIIIRYITCEMRRKWKKLPCNTTCTHYNTKLWWTARTRDDFDPGNWNSNASSLLTSSACVDFPKSYIRHSSSSCKTLSTYKKKRRERSSSNSLIFAQKVKPSRHDVTRDVSYADGEIKATAEPIDFFLAPTGSTPLILGTGHQHEHWQQPPPSQYCGATPRVHTSSRGACEEYVVTCVRVAPTEEYWARRMNYLEWYTWTGLPWNGVYCGPSWDPGCVVCWWSRCAWHTSGNESEIKMPPPLEANDEFAMSSVCLCAGGGDVVNISHANFLLEVLLMLLSTSIYRLLRQFVFEDHPALRTLPSDFSLNIVRWDS